MQQPIEMWQAFVFMLFAVMITAVIFAKKTPMEQRRFWWIASVLALTEAATRASEAFDPAQHPSLRTQLISVPGFLIAGFFVFVLVQAKLRQRRTMR